MIVLDFFDNITHKWHFKEMEFKIVVESNLYKQNKHSSFGWIAMVQPIHPGLSIRLNISIIFMINYSFNDKRHLCWQQTTYDDDFIFL
jgi:hypothetical protein